MLLTFTTLLLSAIIAVLVRSKWHEVPLCRAFSAEALSQGASDHGDDLAQQKAEHQMLVSGAAASVLLLVCWLALVGNTMALDGAFGVWPLICRATALGAALVGTGMALNTLRLAAARAWRTSRQHRPGTAIMLLSAGVTAFSTFALLTFHALFRSPLAATSRNLAGLLEFERVLDLASLTAPVIAVVLFAGIGFVWTTWSLRSLRHHTFGYAASAPILRVLTRGDKQLSRDLADGLGSTVHPTGRYFILPIAVLVFAFVRGSFLTMSIDGPVFSWAIVVGTCLGMLGLTVETAQAAWLGGRLKEALERLRLQPMADEVAARGKDPLDWGIGLDPRFGTARRLLREALAKAKRDLDEIRDSFELRKPDLPPFMSADKRREHVTNEPAPSPAPVSLVEFAAREGLRANDIAWVESWDERAPSPDSRFSQLSLHQGNVDERNRPLLRTQTWDVAVQVGNHMVPALARRFWSHNKRPDLDTLTHRYFRSCEQLISLVIALIVRTLLVRVVRGLSIALVMGTMLFVAHLLYTFPGRTFWLMLDLCVLTIAAVIGARLLVVLERDAIMSRLLSTTPDRVGLKSGLIVRAVAYVVLPLIALFAVGFPEAGGSLLGWIEPLRQTLPLLQ
jgi:hypothetical protein